IILSSRRRHTRFSRDWSSDVCSSDLRYARVESIASSTCAWVNRGFLRTGSAEPEDAALVVLFQPLTTVRVLVDTEITRICSPVAGFSRVSPADHLVPSAAVTVVAELS